MFQSYVEADRLANSQRSGRKRFLRNGKSQPIYKTFQIANLLTSYRVAPFVLTLVFNTRRQLNMRKGEAAGGARRVQDDIRISQNIDELDYVTRHLSKTTHRSPRIYI